MKVGIAGVGFVGDALNHVFTEAVLYDKYKKIGKAKDLDDCDYVFLCLPTLIKPKTRTYDLKAIYEVLKGLGPKPLVIIKSTVAPGTCRKLQKKYNRRIVYNPEFLHQATAVEDCVNAPLIVLGAETDEICEEIFDLYISTKWMGSMYETDWETAELMKLVLNAYLATKISFFNSIYDYAKKLNVNYDTLKFIINQNPTSHGDDIHMTEERGFGGACLPKDINALITAMDKAKVDNKVLKEVWEYNTRIRKEWP